MQFSKLVKSISVPGAHLTAKQTNSNISLTAFGPLSIVLVMFVSNTYLHLITTEEQL